MMNISFKNSIFVLNKYIRLFFYYTVNFIFSKKGITEVIVLCLKSLIQNRH